MNIFPIKQIRPCTLLCSTLVLLLFIFPSTSRVDAGGKKKVVPVKQIFGVGIGYQKVTHYKPVLVFSRHRRMKQKKRRPGWGWKKGWKSYAPVHVQHHVHGRSGPHHRHGGGGAASGWQQPKKMPRHQPQHTEGGWGWRPPSGNSRPPRKGHHPRSRGHRQSQSYRAHRYGGYDYHNEGSSHPAIASGDDYVDEYDAGPSNFRNNYNTRHASNNYYGSPYAGGENYDDDHGGYESEIKNHVLNPLTFPTSNTPATTTNPPPPIFPFTQPPKNDLSVTNIHRDFLRNHLKNFQQFQEYERSTTSNEDIPQHQPSHSRDAPMVMLHPPGPNYSTMDLMNSDSVKVEDTDAQYPQYDDPPEDYYNENWPGAGRESSQSQNYDEEEMENSPGWNEVNKKIMPVASTTTPNPLIPPPPLVVGSPSPHLGEGNGFKTNNNNFRHNKNFHTNRRMLSTTPMPKTKFRASPRVDELGSGNTFNSPGFFPTFDQFQQIKI